MYKKYLRVTIIIMLALSVFIFSFSLAKSTVKDPDTLVIQIEEEIRHLDNRWDGRHAIYDDAVCNQIWGYLGMIAPGETIVTMPGIAEGWTWNADRTIGTFILREGLTFHDGSPLTAEDVEYSWKNGLYVNNYLDNMTDPAWTNIYKFTYASGDSLTFNIEIPANWIDPREEFDFCGQQVFKAIIPKNSIYTEALEIAFDKMPISCGPYMLANEFDWETEKYVLLTRFDDWYGWGMTFSGSNGQTYTFPEVNDAFKYLKFKTIPENAMVLEELKNYNIDVTTGRFSNISNFTDTVATEGILGYQIPILGGASITINHQGDWPSYYGGPGNFPCSEIWFRRAVSHGINRTNIIDEAYQGIALGRNEIFPDWILDKFSSLDTSNYYICSTDAKLAETILDNANYENLGFVDEPDNRFGWGLYKNETSINGVEQTKGYHFALITMNTEKSVNRALTIKRDLAIIGIYLDIELLEEGSYYSKFLSGDSGNTYNTSFTDMAYPDFQGPPFDFSVDEYIGKSETPWDFIAYKNFYYWYTFGYASNSWLNLDWETGYAKIFGIEPGFGIMGFPAPADMPEGGYSVPEWSNNDFQFIAGAEMAGKAIADEVPNIPLIWDINMYAFNEQLYNFLASRNGLYHCAYAYWGDKIPRTNEENSSTSLTPDGKTSIPPLFITPGFSLFWIIIGLSLLLGTKKRK